MRQRSPLLAAALAVALLLTACTSADDQPDPSPSPAPSASPRAGSATGAASGLSDPVEDAVYPQVGDPGVDALHYGLDLAWDPDRSHLDAVETLRLRATEDADHLQLDLAPDLVVSGVRVDGEPAEATHDGKDLVVHHDVVADGRYALEIRYAGTPRPVPAPTHRSDFDALGWTTTRDGEVWTMQEPYGAYSWYAVNDQPSDKALYSFRISAPAGWVGVANGELRSRADLGGRTVTRWELGEPAASYLVTVAIGDLVMTRDRSDSGVPMTYWTPRGRPGLLARLRAAPGGLAWLEQRLGPYPFASLGFLLVDSQSGMETQTMITLGDTSYATSPEVLVHEMAHQWYGDQVTPRDWRDVWMNEGMATYLQGVWTAEQRGEPLADLVREWSADEPLSRREYGPPAAFDPGSFGMANVYYIPALMWHALRHRLGDAEFWRLVRAWPAAHDDGTAGYDDITAWWSEQSGEDLTAFFHDWLVARRSAVG